ncbi:hypothetical protein WOLCODRAFT_108113 [Wolfiporia cocos MD-104 SS10]|uniref:Arrestin C-terminal-like domain-containing protein n=1 Tax=Wolfiporia cocos (strain MD-104) TaxID=742152 RepID=A0A2H3JJ81_WOLCO|nr:hypothetical protein WOLCODRAFT_108113 [Wolfiporia cocos MD-104 SS10]
MSFILTRPPSPRAEMHQPEEDSLVSALHSALQSFSHPASHSTPHTLHAPHDHDAMHREKAERATPSLDIVVNADTLCLRGTGVDVDPALLSGNVVLHLTEPTSIKEIVLQFRGKARLPVSASEPLSLSSSQLTYLVCNHEWSFLEGNRSHAHTLKAGRHLFPFQLQIGGSLPSSIATTALGGASVQYKLRATAVRGGFAITHRDLTATCPITILRGFGPEALEYQQTLEIENTWPEKLMYSIMIPHKAWAAGERVTAVVKFSPLVKGARVLNVTTTINETIKLFARQGTQESTRVVSSTRHDIVDGQALCVDEQHHRYRIPLLHHSHTVHQTHRQTPSVSTPASPTVHTTHVHHAANNGYFPAPANAPVPSHPPSPLHQTADLAPLTTTTTNSSQSSGVASANALTTLAHPSSGSGSDESLPSASAPSPSPLPPLPPAVLVDPVDAALMEPSVDVVTTLNITVPLHATPSHSLEPIQVSHRIRWSILIGNMDGHTSELRCSLPLHVLDHSLYDEARAATLHTRRILLGPQDIEGGMAVGTHGEETAEEDNDLPSYPAHVRDRVANAYLPDSAVMRVVNPWVLQGVSPTLPAAHSESSSGVTSPAAFETWQVAQSNGLSGAHGRHHLPHEPAQNAAPLEWVNTELLLSLSREAPEAPVPPPPPRTSPPSRTPPDHSTASRNMHSLFNAAMKPFTSLSSTFSLGSRSPSHTNLLAHAHAHANGHVHANGHGSGGGASGAPSASASSLNLASLHPPQPMTTPEQLHYAFTEVPDYDMASRGFLGGGITPLSSLRGLPSYEDAAAERGLSAAERSFSDTDLAGRFAAAQRRPPMVGARTADSTPPLQPSAEVLS